MARERPARRVQAAGGELRKGRCRAGGRAFGGPGPALGWLLGQASDAWWHGASRATTPRRSHSLGETGFTRHEHGWLLRALRIVHAVRSRRRAAPQRPGHSLRTRPGHRRPCLYVERAGAAFVVAARPSAALQLAGCAAGALEQRLSMPVPEHRVALRQQASANKLGNDAGPRVGRARPNDNHNPQQLARLAAQPPGDSCRCQPGGPLPAAGQAAVASSAHLQISAAPGR
jgi:hypothetical protein